MSEILTQILKIGDNALEQAEKDLAESIKILNNIGGQQ